MYIVGSKREIEKERERERGDYEIQRETEKGLQKGDRNSYKKT